MSEIRPQITYSPEGMLTINSEPIKAHPISQQKRDISAPAEFIRYRQQALETLFDQPGVVISGEGGIAKVEIEVARNLDGLLGEPHEGSKHGELTKFLDMIDRLLPQPTSLPDNFAPKDQIDRVISIIALQSILTQHASINHHFQRWLDKPGLSEDAARHCVAAMAVMYDESTKAHRNFLYITDDDFEQGWGNGFMVEAAEVDLRLEYLDDVAPYPASATCRSVSLDLPLQTGGNWGLRQDAKKLVRVDPQTRRLYEIRSNGADSARKSLALMLGLGSLAHSASTYEGIEDNFAH